MCKACAKYYNLISLAFSPISGRILVSEINTKGKAAVRLKNSRTPCRSSEMKKILVIGSAVVDVVINLDHLPVKSEDVHVLSQHMSLGGCAYNTSDIIRHFGVPYIPFFPVGTGAYGDFVRSRLAERGITSPIPTPSRDNGCCYCFVEADGERTFASYHGAEYLFERSWFDALDASEISSVYICGLEIEETTGVNIVDYLELHPEFTVFFAPGPRLNRIDPALMERIFRLRPVLHLNEEEALTYTGQTIRSEAAKALYQRSQNTVLITLGKEGCYSYDGTQEYTIPGVPAVQTDTIGAGDSHIGAILAALQLGKTLPEAIAIANRVSARVVETTGALLSDQAFRELFS